MPPDPATTKRDTIDLVSIWVAIINELRRQLQLTEDECFWHLPNARGMHFTPTAPADTFLTVTPDGGTFDAGLIHGGGNKQITVETGFIVTIYKSWHLDEAGHDKEFLTNVDGIGQLANAIILAMTGFDPTFGQYGDPAVRELIRPTGYEQPWRSEELNRGGMSIHFDLTFDLGYGDYADLTTTPEPTTTPQPTTTPPPPVTALVFYDTPLTYPDPLPNAPMMNIVTGGGTHDPESDNLTIGSIALFGQAFQFRALLEFDVQFLASAVEISGAELRLSCDGNSVWQHGSGITLAWFLLIHERVDYTTDANWQQYKSGQVWTNSGGDFDGAFGQQQYFPESSDIYNGIIDGNPTGLYLDWVFGNVDSPALSAKLLDAINWVIARSTPPYDQYKWKLPVLVMQYIGGGNPTMTQAFSAYSNHYADPSKRPRLVVKYRTA